MQRFALIVGGTVRRVSLTQPHPSALPVEFPELLVTPDTHSISLNPAYQWTVHPDKVVATYTIIERDFEAEAAEAEQQKQQAIAGLAAYRFEVETGGLTLPNGTVILSDRESQSLLSSAFQSLSEPFFDSIDWKANGEWVTVTVDEIKPITQAMARHVQACFTAERQAFDGIMSGNSADYKSAFDEALSAILSPN